tara:strand:- start:168 stop:383 length:216 start_codon:yes stop_codon:yes gene_type:complete
MVKVTLQYHNAEETVCMTSLEAAKELEAFLGRFSDSGKKQWMAKMKGKDLPCPWQEGSYDFPHNKDSISNN